MQEVSVGKRVGTRIRTLVARTTATMESIDRATAKATAEEERRQAEVMREYWRQDALEKQLDAIVTRAMKGLAAVIEFGRLPEVQVLVRARSAIRKQTPLYLASEDDRTDVAVLYTGETVELVINGSRFSPVQSARSEDVRRFNECTMKHLFPLMNRKLRFRRAWLRLFFLQDFESHWYDFDVEYDEREVKKHRSVVRERELRSFDLANASAAQTRRWGDDWRCNHVLMSFLCDCSDAKKLNQYFERTLAKVV